MSSKRLKKPLEPESLLDVQPVLDSDDDQRSPECFLSLQPVEDDYSSNDETKKKERCNQPVTTRSKSTEVEIENDKQLTNSLDSIFSLTGSLDFDGAFHSSKKNTKNASKVSQKIITNTVRPTFLTHQCNNDFSKAENPTIAECLEELLDFGLQDNHQRKTIVNGKILFDGMSAEEIIEFWTQRQPRLKWLLENFNQDILKVETTKDHILQTIKEPSILPESSLDDWHNEYLVQDGCYDFVKRFIWYLQELWTYDDISTECEASQDDELHDIYKHVFPLIAQFFDIQNKPNGSCKLRFEMTEVYHDKSHSSVSSKDHFFVAKPDLVLQTRDETINIPVEVYAPTLEANKVDLNASQVAQRKRKFRTQHLLQHIGILHEKIEETIQNALFGKESLCDLDKHIFSVGMFVTRGIVHFTKVATSIKHTSSFLKFVANVIIFRPRGARFFRNNRNRLQIEREMLNNVQKDGLSLIESQWHIDLFKGVHRNAFFIFLLQQFKGDRLFCKKRQD